MGLTVINNNRTLRVVHNTKELSERNALSVVYRRVDKPVIQLVTY